MVISKNIYTHNRNFRASDVLAVILLKKLPEYADYNIKKTDNIANVCDSVEIIYKHFGKEVLRACKIKEECISVIYDKMRTYFIEHINSNETGEDVRWIFTSFYHSDLNKNIDFDQAFQLINDEFDWCLDHLINRWYPIRQSIINSFEKMNDPEILVLDIPCTSWGAHLQGLETLYKTNIKYIVYSSCKDDWMLSAIKNGKCVYDKRNKSVIFRSKSKNEIVNRAKKLLSLQKKRNYLCGITLILVCIYGVLHTH